MESIAGVNATTANVMPASADMNNGATSKMTSEQIVISKKQAAAWNRMQMVGAKVYHRSANGRVMACVTRSKAMTNGAGHALVWLEGVNGGVALSDVWPRSLGVTPDQSYIELITR